jgi:predicted metalloprotease with PDZ domain
MVHIKYVLPLALLLFFTTVYSQKKQVYTYTIDLTKVVNDKVYVELISPTTTKDEITFFMPKIIPGTYSISSFGRFISEFNAVDKRGRALEVIKLNENAWQIKKATKLRKLSYWVDDIMDTVLIGEPIYPMAATNIDESKNFVINSGGFFGYLEGMQKVPFTINVIRDQEFYGTTGLIAKTNGAPFAQFFKVKDPNAALKQVDVFQVSNYDQLVDSPIMYNKPDTTTIRVANTEVLISVYSPNKKISAHEISGSIQDLLTAQMKYLGGKLPVDKYAFIFYFTDEPVDGFGALEHSYSSFYFLPEANIAEITQTIRDVAAHEFFHIITPLTIHSEEIHNFDFNNPKMSKHLWLYEGVTEYFAGHVQVKYGLISENEYLNVIRQKLLIASNFLDNVPFTDISKYTLDKYQDQYYNVYQKGALIGLCLDIKLRSLSNGKYGLQNLIADLSQKFGKDKPFHDDALFSEIVKLTFPELHDFFSRYVEGTEQLPLTELFNAAGITYVPEISTLELSLGLEDAALALTEYNNAPMLTIRNLNALNSQGIAMGFQPGDMLLKINGVPIPKLGTLEAGEFIMHQTNSLKEGGKLSYTVLRKNEQNELKEIELSATARKVERKQRFILSIDPNATEEQVTLRNSWLKGN